MQYWLLKTEPEVFSWEDLVSHGSTIWDGVRNYQARNNLKKMKLGDKAFIYHSTPEKQIVGVATVSKEHFPDPTSDDPTWVSVEIKPLKKLDKKITLQQLKEQKKLSDFALIKQSRLSVIPVTQEQFQIIESIL